MRARFGKRPDVFADQSPFADVDQFFSGFALNSAQLVLIGNFIEVVDDAAAQVGAVARFEQKLVQAVRFSRRMLVELESLVQELEAAVLIRDLGGSLLSFSMRQESHHAQPVVPGGDV